LLTDKRFYFESGDELLTAYRDITKRIDPELTRMFRTLPRLTYGVREIPAFRGASSSGAEYQGGSLEAGRGGWFQANTYDLKSRPKWKWKRWPSTKASPVTTCKFRFRKRLKEFPNSASTGAIPLSPKAGRFTPNLWARDGILQRSLPTLRSLFG